MAVIPPIVDGRKVVHKRHAFATGVAATVLVTAPGTGLVIIPVYMSWYASAAGTLTLTKGSGGASMANLAFLAGVEVGQMPWWDDGASNSVGANTSIEITKATGVGAGAFDIWYIVKRLGAGSSGTEQ